MRGIATEKVQEGKLVRVKVEYGEKIDSVKKTGDFFMHPEEGVAEMEASLAGIPKESSQEEISEILKSVVKEKGITLIGVTEDAVAKLVKEAME